MCVEVSWNGESFRNELQHAPQLVMVKGVYYLCYTELLATPGTFVGVRDNCHHTFLVTHADQKVTPITPSNTVLTVSAHHVAAGQLLKRMRRCHGCDPREAVDELFTSGLAIPPVFCEGLIQILKVLDNQSATAELRASLTMYAHQDLQGSVRLRSACANALKLLIDWFGPEEA